MLEAKAKSCFHPLFVLHHDGRPIGQFRDKWLSEGMEIQLLGRRNLQLRSESLFGGRFALIDSANGHKLATAERQGLFIPRWRTDLSCGPSELVSASWMLPRFRILVAGQPGGIVHSRWCSFGWKVEPNFEMPIVDQLMVGLLFHVMLKRHHRHQRS